MEPCDGVKLLYQSRFGCGHLLPPDGQLVERIRAEADELPENAKSYVEYLERTIGVPISIVAVGPDRDQTIMRGWQG